MGVISDGNSYGVPDDLLYSFPVVIKNKTWKFVEDQVISKENKFISYSSGDWGVQDRGVHLYEGLRAVSSW